MPGCGDHEGQLDCHCDQWADPRHEQQRSYRADYEANREYDCKTYRARKHGGPGTLGG
jgi:hypothetical protein